MTTKPLFRKLVINLASAASVTTLILLTLPDLALGHGHGAGPPPRPSIPMPRNNMPVRPVMPPTQINNQIRQQMQNQRAAANRPGQSDQTAQSGDMHVAAANGGPDFDTMSDDELAAMFDQLFDDVVNADIGSSILDAFFDAAADPNNADKDPSELLDGAVDGYVRSHGGSSTDAEDAADAVVDDIFGSESRIGWSDSSYNQPEPVVLENPPGGTSLEESDRIQEEIRVAVPVPPPLPVEQQEENLQQLPTNIKPGDPVPLDTNIAAQIVPGGGRISSADISYDPETGTRDIFIQKENGVDVLISVRADGTVRTTVVLPGTSEERIAARGNNPGVTIEAGTMFSPQTVYQDAPGGPALDWLIAGLDVAVTAGDWATWVISVAPGVGAVTSLGAQAINAGANAYNARAMQDVNAGRDINQLAAAGQGTVQAGINLGANVVTGEMLDGLGDKIQNRFGDTFRDAGVNVGMRMNAMGARRLGGSVNSLGRRIGGTTAQRAGQAMGPIREQVGAAIQRSGQAISRSAITVGAAIRNRSGEVIGNDIGNRLAAGIESHPVFSSPQGFGGTLDRAVDRAYGAPVKAGNPR